ncbi:hypothetical protein K0U27_06620 [archaeon]|nr:hypothetical protein [archaeon]
MTKPQPILYQKCPNSKIQMIEPATVMEKKKSMSKIRCVKVKIVVFGHAF